MSYIEASAASPRFPEMLNHWFGSTSSISTAQLERNKAQNPPVAVLMSLGWIWIMGKHARLTGVRAVSNNSFKKDFTGLFSLDHNVHFIYINKARPTKNECLLGSCIFFFSFSLSPSPCVEACSHSQSKAVPNFRVLLCDWQQLYHSKD